MAKAKVCPPGVFCLSPFTGVVVGLGILLLIVAISQWKDTNHSIALLKERTAKPVSLQVNNVNEGGDDRYTRAPEPQRFWNNGPEVPRGALIPPDGGVLVNVPTQGLPEAYQQMGILKTNEGGLLPLYGRRVASRSDRFNYYTRTDTYNPVQLPIHYKRKDCQDPVGCHELFDGDTVKITPTGQEATATLYRFDGPLYVPNIL